MPEKIQDKEWREIDPHFVTSFDSCRHNWAGSASIDVSESMLFEAWQCRLCSPSSADVAHQAEFRILVSAVKTPMEAGPARESTTDTKKEGPMKRIAFLAALAIMLSGSVLPSYALADEAESQKAVLITGASTGIGRNAAERLAAAGYFVYAGARKAADIEELNKIDNVMAVRLDVTKQDEIDAAVEQIRKEGRGLWGIVNNAGVNVVAPLIEADVSELEFLFDVNVYGVFRVTKAFAPLVIESSGRIVNISSISGVLSGNGYGMYAASKHAVEAFTDSLAREMEDLDVLSPQSSRETSPQRSG